ncbi:MAG: helicase [Deltaproteobacteria bacterium]|nr:MAG: helicase [Deltaproteobacteria bacterium]
MELRPGKKVRYRLQPEWGIGHLLELSEGGSRALVLFPGREEPVLVSTRDGALEPVVLSPGDRIRIPGAVVATVTEVVDTGEPLCTYRWRVDDEEEGVSREDEVLPLPPRPDLLSSLEEGRVGSKGAFLLRRDALRLDEERRADALGALLASRVMVRPYQVGVVQRVLTAPEPRFVLADEVGLGKTIESGMIFTALRLAGLARRVLVVAPSHLTVQWLAELYHKFSQLFTLMDGARYTKEREAVPDESPWARFDLCVTSLELLARSESHRAEVGAPDARWDLVIIDEAHHLKGDRAFEAARALARNTWGLLLLTATPLQLDPDEYYRLLTLVDPDAAPDPETFAERVKAQALVSEAVRILLSGGDVEAARRKLADRFPEDPYLAAPEIGEGQLLAHLADTYSLSDRLIRNRRAVVGGFAERRLHRHPVTLGKEEARARQKALQSLKNSDVRGAALARVLRRIESSPAAFREVVASGQVPESVAREIPERGAKLDAFLSLVDEIHHKEPGAKILVFTEARTTLEWLVQRLGEAGIPALGYHGDMEMVERDRRVARFRDPEGPSILVCTEVGGEGRNFQFAHHLVNYDLPWSPATMEQRIGRLDRIGQTRPVEIHCFDAAGTLSAEVLAILADAVGVFSETVGGLDAVLEGVEAELARLALETPAARRRFAKALAKRVEAAREQVRRAYDPLLDLRSFDRAEVERLCRRALKRLGLDEELEEDVGLEDALWAIARDLDERMEEVVVDLARRIGIGADTEEAVEAFEVAFHFGHTLTVDALPGLEIREEQVKVGTFWRDTAIEREEIEYFATGHPLVEALFGFLRDGPFGRTAARWIRRRGGRSARGIEFLFSLEPPEPEDTHPGARVPSRHLSRFLEGRLIQVVVEMDGKGRPVVAPDLTPLLEARGKSLRGEMLRKAFPALPTFVEGAVEVAREAAGEILAARARQASAAIEAEAERAVERLGLALAWRGLEEEEILERVRRLSAHYEAVLAALEGVEPVLDSAAVFVIE